MLHISCSAGIELLHFHFLSYFHNRYFHVFQISTVENTTSYSFSKPVKSVLSLHSCLSSSNFQLYTNLRQRSYVQKATLTREICTAEKKAFPLWRGMKERLLLQFDLAQLFSKNKEPPQFFKFVKSLYSSIPRGTLQPC